MKNRTSYLLALFLAPLLHFSCGKLAEPEFRGIENFKVGQLGVKESTFTLDLHYFNPNRSGLKLKEAEGDAWMDGNYLGHFIMDTLINVTAQNDFRLPILFKAASGQLLNNSLLSLFGQESLLKVEGKARVGKGGIYIRYPIHYEGKHNLGELLRK